MGKHSIRARLFVIAYSSCFISDRQIVSVTGKVYLEVVKERETFYIGNLGKQRKELQGTSFTIHASDDNGQLLTGIKFKLEGRRGTVII